MLHYFDIEGHRLAAWSRIRVREGEPVVLIHGIALSIFFWAPDPIFVDEGPCHSLSLPDHAPAATPPALREPVTMERIAGMLATALRELTGGRPATLVGASTGGCAALAIAALYPALVRRVITIGGFAHGRWTGSIGLLQTLALAGPPGRAPFLAAAWLLTHVPAFTRLGWRTATPRLSLRAYAGYPAFTEMLAATAPCLYQLDLEAMRTYFAAMAAVDIAPLLPAVRVPVLVTFGSRDPIVPPRESRRIAAAVPRSTLVSFPGAGHVPHIEHYAAFRACVRAWMHSTC